MMEYGEIAESRWMPPSPHKEAILDMLQKGRAHIEEQGHGLPPLLICEDGGALELHRVRLVEGRLMAMADAALPEISTKYTDVCGTIDELKRLWQEQPELAEQNPDYLQELLAHALRMLKRMHQRWEAYRQFACSVQQMAQEILALQLPPHAPAADFAQQIRQILAEGSEAVCARREELFRAAESIRKIAGDTEQVLYRCRDLAIEIGGAYEDIRGARQWQRPKNAGTDKDD